MPTTIRDMIRPLGTTAAVPLRVAGVPIVDFEQHHDGVAARVPPDLVERANAYVADHVREAGKRGQRRHDNAGAQQPDGRRRPSGIWGLPVSKVAEECRNEERNGKWNEHRVDRMTSDARSAFRIRHGNLPAANPRT